MLSNPSTIAQQQKLELYKGRFEAASTALGVAGVVDRLWVQKNILRFTDEEIKAIQSGLRSDKISDLVTKNLCFKKDKDILTDLYKTMKIIDALSTEKETLQSNNDKNITKICKYNNKGYCKYDINCPYRHFQHNCYEFLKTGTCSQ